jgi:carboxylesterase type B
MPDETTGLPVILWIHGGGFRYGSAAQYGPEPLTQNDVIFVPVQYRLGTLGVLGQGTKDFSGNLAMFDMAAALRWVQDYISFFGGDPKQIKVVGHGSGAASAMYLSNSRVPRDAISGCAAMSGSAMSQYAYDKEPAQSVKDVAEIHGCPTDNETAIVGCLREKTLEELVVNDNKIQTERLAGQQMVRSLSGSVGYEPVVEGEDDKRALPGIITEKPDDALKNKSFRKVPLLIGVTKDETANGIVRKKEVVLVVQRLIFFFSAAEVTKSYESATKFLDSVSKSLGLEKFLNLNPPKLPGLTSFGLTDYLKVPDDLNPEKLLAKLTEATTDALFNLPALVTAQFWGELAPSFLYSFEHPSNLSSGRNFLAGLPLVSKGGDGKPKDAVAHGDELGFLFDTNDIFGNPIEGGQPQTPEDLKARKAITKLLADFARIKPEGEAEKDGGIFKAFSKKGTPFIKVTSELKLENDFR